MFKYILYNVTGICKVHIYSSCVDRLIMAYIVIEERCNQQRTVHEASLIAFTSDVQRPHWHQ